MRAAEASGTDRGSAGRHVLIVDDDPMVLDLLVDVAEASGLRPVPCRTLASARQALRQEPPAVAIVDDDLPDGRGTELVQELRSSRRGRRVRVIFCTSAEAPRRSEIGRIAPVIHKPFSLREVERVMREALPR